MSSVKGLEWTFNTVASEEMYRIYGGIYGWKTKNSLIKL